VFVPRGAPIARLVDCSSLRVLAYVSAYKYNRIAVGDRAAIEVLPGRRRYAGTVAFRLGSSDLLLSVGTAVTIPANQRERFAIVVSSSEMAADLGDRCEIGQNAEVTFYPGTAS
jgi:hypothetical protein